MYRLGKTSNKRLIGVKDDLVAVVRMAIQITTQDFSVFSGLRTIEEQRALYESKQSRTMNSRHLTGDAVDLVPYVGGKLLWEWEYIYPMAVAVRSAAQALDVNLVWGGAWDINFTKSIRTPEQIVRHYIARRHEMELDAFTDGVHFQRVVG